MSDPLEPDIQIVVNHHLHAGHRTLVFMEECPEEYPELLLADPFYKHLHLLF